MVLTSITVKRPFHSIHSLLLALVYIKTPRKSATEACSAVVEHVAGAAVASLLCPPRTHTHARCHSEFVSIERWQKALVRITKPYSSIHRRCCCVSIHRRIDSLLIWKCNITDMFSTRQCVCLNRCTEPRALQLYRHLIQSVRVCAAAL